MAVVLTNDHHANEMCICSTVIHVNMPRQELVVTLVYQVYVATGTLPGPSGII